MLMFKIWNWAGTAYSSLTADSCPSILHILSHMHTYSLSHTHTHILTRTHTLSLNFFFSYSLFFKNILFLSAYMAMEQNEKAVVLLEDALKLREKVFGVYAFKSLCVCVLKK